MLLHLLPQLLEAGFQAVVERPQRFRDLVSVDADPFGKVWNLRRHRRQEWATFMLSIKGLNGQKGHV